MSVELKKQMQEESDRLVAEFLAKGGKITHFAAGQRSEANEATSFWGKKPAKKTEEKSKE